MNTWIYAGTFDPITNGHLDIIERAAKKCDKLIVAVVESAKHKKKGLLDIQERVLLAEKSIQHITNVSVVSFSGLLVDFAVTQEAAILVRGLRTVSDFEYEMSIAQLNKMLNSQLETMYILTDPKWSFCSSSAVRELHSLHSDISPLVPQAVTEYLSNISE